MKNSSGDILKGYSIIVGALRYANDDSFIETCEKAVSFSNERGAKYKLKMWSKVQIEKCLQKQTSKIIFGYIL